MSAKYSIDGTIVEIEPTGPGGAPELRVIEVLGPKATPDLIKAAMAQHEAGRIHGRVIIDGHSYTISRLIPDDPAGPDFRRGPAR